MTYLFSLGGVDGDLDLKGMDTAEAAVGTLKAFKLFRLRFKYTFQQKPYNMFNLPRSTTFPFARLPIRFDNSRYVGT